MKAFLDAWYWDMQLYGPDDWMGFWLAVLMLWFAAWSLLLGLTAKRPRGHYLRKIARSCKPKPLVKVTAPSWLARILIAGGAQKSPEV